MINEHVADTIEELSQSPFEACSVFFGGAHASKVDFNYMAGHWHWRTRIAAEEQHVDASS